MKLYFAKCNTFQKYDLKKVQVKVKSTSKVMPVFVFCLWCHFWETFRTAANFLNNSSLSKNTRFLMLGQVFNQSLGKFTQKESTCFKTLKLKFFCKMLGLKQRSFYDVIFQSFSKQFQGSLLWPTTIKTSTLPAICIFKR